jgi:zinc transporter, ZIP family
VTFLISFFIELDPIFQALLATTFTWGVTAVGASLVFLVRTVNKRTMDIMLGFAAGVMVAASFWSLLLPAIEISIRQGLESMSWLPAAAGFVLGGLSIWGMDKVLPHLHPNLPPSLAEGPKTSSRRTVLMVSAITLHNIPEGLAVGIAFGAAALGLPESSIGAAIALAIGIALQNFPEGTIVSMPLRQDGMSAAKSFGYGQLSAAVEPLAGVLGVLFIHLAQDLLPYLFGFAAGAMIFVVIEEVIPAYQGKNIDLATMAFLIGFVIMMALDIGLS